MIAILAFRIEVLVLAMIDQGTNDLALVSSMAISSSADGDLAHVPAFHLIIRLHKAFH